MHQHLIANISNYEACEHDRGTLLTYPLSSRFSFLIFTHTLFYHSLSMHRFASPSGLVGSGPNLFVVDSEAALVRGVNLIEGYSKTVLGGDKRSTFAGSADSSDLRQFEGFGDLDTAGYKVRVCQAFLFTKNVLQYVCMYLPLW